MKNRNLHAGKPAQAESSATYIDAEKTFSARNYDPLPLSATEFVRIAVEVFWLQAYFLQ